MNSAQETLKRKGFCVSGIHPADNPFNDFVHVAEAASSCRHDINVFFMCFPICKAPVVFEGASCFETVMDTLLTIMMEEVRLFFRWRIGNMWKGG